MTNPLYLRTNAGSMQPNSGDVSTVSLFGSPFAAITTADCRAGAPVILSALSGTQLIVTPWTNGMLSTPIGVVTVQHSNLFFSANKIVNVGSFGCTVFVRVAEPVVSNNLLSYDSTTNSYRVYVDIAGGAPAIGYAMQTGGAGSLVRMSVLTPIYLTGGGGGGGGVHEAVKYVTIADWTKDAASGMWFVQFDVDGFGIGADFNASFLDDNGTLILMTYNKIGEVVTVVSTKPYDGTIDILG